MQTPTRSIGEVFDAYPASAAALGLLQELAEQLARESVTEPLLDQVVLDLLLAVRRLHTVLASLTGCGQPGDQTPPQQTTLHN